MGPILPPNPLSQIESCRVIFEISPNPLLLLDEQYNIVEINNEFSQIMGCPKTKLLNKPISTIFANSTEFDEASTLLNRTNQLSNFAMTPNTCDGSDLFVLLNVRQIIDDKKVFFGYLLSFTEYTASKKRSHDLDERIKELKCLYGLDQILEKTELPIQQIFQNIVDFLPSGWQYPDHAQSKVEFDQKSYISKGYQSSKWKQRNNILIKGIIRGYIEIVYLKKMPNSFEGPFLREERHLINAITERIETVFEKRVEEQARMEAEAQLQEHAHRLEISLKEKEVLLMEINHRVKNNLQLIFSLILLQEQYVTDEKLQLMYRDFKNRVKAMSQIHETLYSSGDITKINFEAYIQEIVTNLFNSYYIKENTIDLTVKIEQIELSFNKTILCGLIVNEIVSNVLKYAFPDNQKGKLLVKIKKYKRNDQISIKIQDNGVGLPSNVDYTNTDTLGLRIVTSLSKQLKGKLSMESKDGVKFELLFHE